MKHIVKTFAIILTLSCLSFSQIFSQNTESTRNPWQMTQQQYELYESTSVSQLNASPGAHPNYGALSLPEVSYVTNQPDNGPQPTQAQFRFLAAPSHYLKDDPIVFPDQPGASHLHMFFGNTRADANSEVGTGSQNDLLIRGASTVQGGKGANPSAYWVPAMVDGPLGGCDSERKIILPDVITVYYKTRHPGEAELIPEGLQIIGGNVSHSPGGMVHGMTIQNSSGGSFREGARWGFYDPAQGLIVQGQPTIPQSNPNGYKWIRAAIGFPQCFAAESDGGFVLSSPDNLSHQHILENAQGGNRDDQPCPGSHPNRIAKVEILLDFRWPDDNDVSGWRLSSDMNAATAAQVPHPGGSLHGDILFAWNPKVQQAWKDECHDPNDPRNCSIGQTGTQWVLDRINNTGTISNMAYTGQTDYLTDPYDNCVSCPAAGTSCDDGNPNTINDVEDGNCNCAGTPLPVSDCDLITNGDFSNGTTDWLSWSCDVDASSGACRITNIQQVQNPWNAALVQGDFTLENGKQYEVSFDANSIQNSRTIKVKVGLSEAPYTNYNYEEITLTPNSQRFTMSFPMTEPTTTKGRLEFHIGTNTNGLVLDNIRVKAADADCPSECDLLTNGNFSNGTTDWFGWSCNVDAVGNACQITNIQQVQNPWNAALAQGDFTLENGKQYEVSFNANSIQNSRMIKVKVGLSEAPYTGYIYQEISLNTTNQRFTIPFTMPETTTKGRLEFHVGTNTTGLVVDNIQLISLSDDCGDNNDDCEQVQNGNFTGQFTDDWIIQNCQATTANNGININVPYVAQNPWNIAVKQRGLNYEQGKEYQISFMAKANVPRVIRVKAGKSSTPYTTYNYETINLTTTLQTYTFTFTMDNATDSNAFLEFFLGESDVNLSLGEVSVVETACVGLREGLFNETITHYEVFPNPVSDNLNISLGLTAGYDTGIIRLFDLTGRIILEEEKALSDTNQFQLNIQAIPAGIYMLRVDVGGYFLTHKVVKY